MPTMTPSRAEELLAVEETDAWFEYLHATKGQPLARYEEVEPWAWAKLTQRLRATDARRARLIPVRDLEDDGA